jgi:hypothetical protein
MVIIQWIWAPSWNDDLVGNMIVGAIDKVGRLPINVVINTDTKASMIEKVEGILVGFHSSFLCDLGSNDILNITPTVHRF